MGTTSATERLIGVLAFLMVVGCASQAHAQLGVGTTWVRTDAAGKGIVLNVEACCNGGLRLIYHVPAMGGQPAMTMSVDSPMKRHGLTGRQVDDGRQHPWDGKPGSENHRDVGEEIDPHW